MREGSEMSSIYAFSKRIKEGNVVHHRIADSEDIAKIGQVIDKLTELPKTQQLKLDELQLRTNVKEWANSLVMGYPDDINEKEMGYLLSDFTDTMKTRMREESKYAIGLLMPDNLILCHSSFGEETITPEWKTIPRMLDTDNVSRYVRFINDKGIIVVRYWEREATSSFMEWLGLPQKAAFLFGGKYRIRCEIEGITTELQLTEPEMERWLETHSELKNGTIEFSTPVQLLRITEIMVGRRRYDKPEDFIQDYEAEKQGIPYYQREYEKLNKDILPLLVKYYDEKTQVVRRDEDQVTIVVAKSTPIFDILFADSRIEFRESYLNDLVKRFVNGEAIKIYHAGVKFNMPPFIIGSMEIYNQIQIDSLTQQIIDYYQSVSLLDKNLIMLLRYTIIRKLAEINNKAPIFYFFQRLSEEIMKLATLHGKWAKLEDKVIEYKSSDVFTGNNEEIIEKLAEDFERKLKDSYCKIYFIGVEDDGSVNPLPSNRLKSDRIEHIRNGLQEMLNFASFYACPVIQEQAGILLIAAIKK